MHTTRTPVLGLLWLALAAAYLVTSALGQHAGAMAVLGLIVGAMLAGSGRVIAGLATGTVLALLAWRFASEVHALVYLPPLAAFAFMGFFFGRTLRPGAVPLIVRIARKEHPDLPEDMARHARWLTAAWTACFAALFIVTLALAPLVPLATWSLWVHGLGYLVPGAFFLGEYAYRLRKFPHRSQGSLAVLIPNVIAVIHESAMESGKRPPARGEQG